jgi:hypothetical protein
MAKLKRGLLYLGLHNKLRNTYGDNQIISRKEFFWKFSMHISIPKPLRPHLIKEMVAMGLLEVVNRDSLKICSLDLDIEKDYWKLIRLIEETKDL